MTTTDRRDRAEPDVAGATEALDDIPGAVGRRPARPPLRYLRRKPGRGLVAVFGPGRPGGDMYTVTVDERTRPVLEVAAPTAWPAARRVQQFPGRSEAAAHLDAAMAPSQPDLAAALESTRAAVHDVPGDAATAAASSPSRVRYKPGDRCVPPLPAALRRPGPTAPGRAAAPLVAKLPGGPSEAQAADELLDRLRDRAAVSWTARPLARGARPAAGADRGSRQQPRPRAGGLGAGRRASRCPRTRSGRSAAPPVALAELHTSGTRHQPR